MEHANTISPPYGPTANLKAIFDTWRDRSMPEQLSKEWLERIGISPFLAAKNLQALRFLGLIDESGFTTDTAQRLRTASSEEYPPVLEEIIRKAYRKVFEIRNPTVDSRTRIDDAFRHEQPQAQRSRMVACFLGLCALAGIPLKEAPPQRDAPARRVNATAKKARTEAPGALDARPQSVPARALPPEEPRMPGASITLNPVLAGLLKTVPEIESADDLDEWYQVFRAAFLFVKNMAAKSKSEAGP
jgi:hypothetical protein